MYTVGRSNSLREVLLEVLRTEGKAMSFSQIYDVVQQTEGWEKVQVELVRNKLSELVNEGAIWRSRYSYLFKE